MPKKQVKNVVKKAVDKEHESKTVRLKVDDLLSDELCQCRAKTNQKTVEHYVEDMKNGAEFPAVTVFVLEDGRQILADGFHRCEAHRALGKSHIEVRVMEGTELEARLFAIKANMSHGLPLKNNEKKKALESIYDEVATMKKPWPNTKIAEMIGCCEAYVRKVFKEIKNSRKSVNTTLKCCDETETGNLEAAEGKFRTSANFSETKEMTSSESSVTQVVKDESEKILAPEEILRIERNKFIAEVYERLNTFLRQFPDKTEGQTVYTLMLGLLKKSGSIGVQRKITKTIYEQTEKVYNSQQQSLQ